MTKLLKEIRDLLKEILAELKQQKEPIDLTIDSEKFAFALSNVTQKSEGIEINRK